MNYNVIDSLERLTRALQELTESERVGRKPIVIPERISASNFKVSREIDLFLERIEKYRVSTENVRVGQY